LKKKEIKGGGNHLSKTRIQLRGRGGWAKKEGAWGKNARRTRKKWPQLQELDRANLTNTKGEK